MKSLPFVQGVLLLLVVCGGCGPTDLTITKKASYADLVVTYNAEVQALDRLEEKRRQAVAEYFAQAQDKALKDAVNSLKPGGESQSPNDSLDRAVAAAEAQAQLQSGLLEKIGSSSSSAAAIPESEYPEELKAKLAGLNAEIADQKARVERARAARDAAEPK